MARTWEKADLKTLESQEGHSVPSDAIYRDMQYVVDGTSYRYIANEKGLVYGPLAHQLMGIKSKLKANSKGAQVYVKQSFSGSPR